MKPEDFELTIEQQFTLRTIERSVPEMSREQMMELLIDSSRLLMLKDNMIRSLAREAVANGFG